MQGRVPRGGIPVRDHTRSAEWAAVGILVDTSTGVQINNNTIRGCFYGIYLGDATTVTVSGNILTDNIKRGISLDKASNNTISGNTITGPVGGTDDTAIGLANNCAGNMIGGATTADGNTITMATSGTGNLYAIYMQANVGANANTISNNTITGGQRAVQFDGPPGTTGTTTITKNIISGQAFGGIMSYCQGSLVITDNTITGTDRPLEFWQSGVGDITISGNTLTSTAYDVINAGSFATMTVHNNNLSSTGSTAINNRTNTSIDAENNWWGSAVGPGASQISGPVDFTPWCTDATCLHTAPDASGNVNLSGNISVPGGILINEPGITYHLAANTVIQNNSPCFVIEASNTIIEAEPGAKCIPTNGANGIDVAAGLNNITIEGIEFDGSGQETGDGIHFAGAVTDIVLVDNYLHDLDSDGIEFAGDVAEVVNIQGNMFKANGGLGINNLGASTVGAEYNSWGDVAGPTGTNGDGVSAKVTYEPFTHADLYLVSSGTPWANQVVKGQQITYTVKAHLVNVNAADFVLTYPAELTYVSSAASGSMGTESVIHIADAHTLQFIGYNTANLTGDLSLFTVTFTAANTVANAPLSFSYGTTSGFGMVGYESSSNVFVNEMVNGTVTVIDLPTINSTDIQGYYLVGEQREFHVTATNPSTGGSYAHVIFQFNVTADAGDLSLEYYEGSTWHALPLTCASGVCSGYYGPSTGFPMPNPYSATSLFRVTAAVPGSYPVEIKLLDLDTDPDAVLATYTNTAVVYDKPSVTSTDIQGYYLSGEQREFSVVLTNPILGGNFAHVYVNYTIAHADMDEIQTIEYSVDHTTWVTLGAAGSGTSYGEDGYGNIVGFFGQIAGGGFPMVPNSTQTTWFRVTFKVREQGATDYPTSYDISMQLKDADFTPDDRQLNTFSATAYAYDKPTLTSTDIIGPYLAGVPKDFHMTVDNPATGGNFVNSIYYVFTIANAEPTDIASLSCNGIPVTLTDSGADLTGRVGYGSAGFPMPPDEQWTNTCNVQFAKAGSYVFTVDMVDNPGSPASDRLLVSFQATAEVNGNFAVTGTFSMQGNASRAGIPVTLTWGGTLLGPYGPGALTSNLVSGNFSLSVLYGGEYTITTLQPRYLNVTADLLKKINVAGPYNMSALILKGGNAYWKSSATELDNLIDTGDASIVGTQYGGAGSDAGFGNHGDCNFDGIVNIQDLALVGGNFTLNAANAYAGWAP